MSERGHPSIDHRRIYLTLTARFNKENELTENYNVFTL